MCKFIRRKVFIKGLTPASNGTAGLCKEPKQGSRRQRILTAWRNAITRDCSPQDLSNTLGHKSEQQGILTGKKRTGLHPTRLVASPSKEVQKQVSC